MGKRSFQSPRQTSEFDESIMFTASSSLFLNEADLSFYQCLTVKNTVAAGRVWCRCHNSC